MRRMRNKDATKVWHNPEIMVSSRARGPATPRPGADDRRPDAPEARAALDVASRIDERRAIATPAKPGRIVLPAPPDRDPRAIERQRLLANLLRASGRPAVSKAANDFLGAGFTFPDQQEVQLQLLEHASEDHVCTAIDKLAAILVEEEPQRRAVLESRLRRIEQFADEPATRAAAERLRRQVSGRGDGPSFPA